MNEQKKHGKVFIKGYWKQSLAPFTKHLKRVVTEDEYCSFNEIRIKRISKFDIDKAQQLHLNIWKERIAVKHN